MLSLLVPACTGNINDRPAFLTFTSRVSVGTGGIQSDQPSHSPACSADGRFIVFASHATTFVSPTNGKDQIYRYDTMTHTTECVSVTPAGVPAGDDSEHPSISDDGQFVAFESIAADLIPGLTGNSVNIFVRDMNAGITSCVSITTGGTHEDIFDANNATISGDGRYIAFESFAQDLVAGGTAAGVSNIFLRDSVLNTTSLVSWTGSGAQITSGSCMFGTISGDGHWVLFVSTSSQIVSGTTAAANVFLRDLVQGKTTCVSLNYLGQPANAASGIDKALVNPPLNKGIAISTDGRWVAFSSFASDLLGAPQAASLPSGIYVVDRLQGTTELVSANSLGAPAVSDVFRPSISGDGRYVSFESIADNLVVGKSNNATDVFIHDRLAETTLRASVSTGLGQATPFQASQEGVLSRDGRFIAFSSFADNLVEGDTNAVEDVFLRGPLH
ncbi:MAG TPA: calcium-binding protein [Planctomycetota bacterium]|nr:calcium-binding protein [Planctomycetota bacterium]